MVDGERLAYVSDAPVNWCPGLGTVVANEEVTADGRSDRGNFPVFKRNMRQWMMRITAYADRLLEDLDRLDWTDSLKTMQRNWIGRSSAPASTSTPRPDRSPCSPRGPTRCSARRSWWSRPSTRWCPTSPRRRWRARWCSTGATWPGSPTPSAPDEDRQKTGVFTGSYATNPATGKDIPIWVADYVLMGYGTGAIMAVPCGDERDFEFAQVYGLDIPAIQQPPDEWFERHGIDPTLDTRWWRTAFIGDAPYVNSSNREIDLDGLTSVARGHRHRQRLARAHRQRRGDGQLQAARLAVQPPALLGRAVPDRLGRRGQAHVLPDDLLPLSCPTPTASRRGRSTPTTSSPSPRARSTG